MDGELLDSTTLNTLKEERQRLRHFISMKRTAAQVIPNSVNFEDFKAKFNRLQEIEERILGHMLAENTDVEAALASHQKYADMAEYVIDRISPPATNSYNQVMFPDFKLPSVSANDPISWLNLIEVFEAVTKVSPVPPEMKKLQLMTALDKELAAEIRSLSFDEAMRYLKTKMESSEKFLETIQAIFSGLPTSICWSDKHSLKRLHRAVCSVLTMTNDKEIRQEAFQLATHKLSYSMLSTFLDKTDAKDLESLSAFLKKKLKHAEWLSEIQGHSTVTEQNLRPRSFAGHSKPSYSNQTISDEEDVSYNSDEYDSVYPPPGPTSSGSSKDEVKIDATGRPASLLYDMDVTKSPLLAGSTGPSSSSSEANESQKKAQSEPETGKESAETKPLNQKMATVNLLRDDTNRLVVPSKLQTEALRLLHSTKSDLTGNRKMMNSSRTKTKHLVSRVKGPYLVKKMDSKWKYRLPDELGNRQQTQND